MQVNDKAPETERDTNLKMRRCLMCGLPFTSAWAGERVCAKCKSMAAWRSG